MTVQKMLEIQHYLRQTKPDLKAGSHEWRDAMRVIAGLSDITFSGNAQVSLAQAKDEIFALIHDETSRHEEELELAMALYEANIRVENKYHKSRIIELDRIRDMLNKCALDWGCLPKG